MGVRKKAACTSRFIGRQRAHPSGKCRLWSRGRASGRGARERQRGREKGGAGAGGAGGGASDRGVGGVGGVGGDGGGGRDRRVSRRG